MCSVVRFVPLLVAFFVIAQVSQFVLCQGSIVCWYSPCRWVYVVLLVIELIRTYSSIS